VAISIRVRLPPKDLLFSGLPTHTSIDYIWFRWRLAERRNDG
jgi:hypothetical protein